MIQFFHTGCFFKFSQESFQTSIDSSIEKPSDFDDF